MKTNCDNKKLDFIDRVRKHWYLRNSVLSLDVADFIACQFALESNFGTSRLASIQNNFCGMRVPSKRAFFGYSFSGDSSFAAYNGFDECIIDYVSWLFYNRPNSNELKYVDSFQIFLRNTGYCPELTYVGRINVLYNQFKNHLL